MQTYLGAMAGNLHNIDLGQKVLLYGLGVKAQRLWVEVRYLFIELGGGEVSNSLDHR